MLFEDRAKVEDMVVGATARINDELAVHHMQYNCVISIMLTARKLIDAKVFVERTIAV